MRSPELAETSSSAALPVGPALARSLRDLLPADARVVICWRDPVLGDAYSADDTAPTTLIVRALGTLGTKGKPRDAELRDHWTTDQGVEIVLAAHSPSSVATPLRQGWQALARHAVAASIEALQASARIATLQKSERLQQALYEIADLAGSNLEMHEMLRRIHAVVGGLMYAENCFIVLYDELRQSLRFLYFADRHDPYIADPSHEIPVAEVPTSLTMALLRHGEPLLGPSAALRARLNIPHDPLHGPDSEDWLGVPMRREGQVCGAIVVQSYEHRASYSDEDRALLTYVAQHILTALDRRQARSELERRVEERTYALQDAVGFLQGVGAFLDTAFEFAARLAAVERGEDVLGDVR